MEGCLYLNFMSINRFILYLLYACFYSFILFFFFVVPKSPNLGPNLTFFCRPVVAPNRGPHPLPGRPIFRPNKAMCSVHPATSLFSREKTHQKPNSVHISSAVAHLYVRPNSFFSLDSPPFLLQAPNTQRTTPASLHLRRRHLVPLACSPCTKPSAPSATTQAWPFSSSRLHGHHPQLGFVLLQRQR